MIQRREQFEVVLPTEKVFAIDKLVNCQVFKKHISSYVPPASVNIKICNKLNLQVQIG